MAKRTSKTKSKSGRLKSVGSRSSVEDLLSGKVPVDKKASRRKRKKAKPTENLTGDLSTMADLFAAGRRVYKEIEFKVRFAEQRVKDYCLKRFSDIFAQTGVRPPSIDYKGGQSHFTYIQTSRINLTRDKVDALKEMGIPVEKYTVLSGLDINYRAIRDYELEDDLRAALEGMGLDSEVLEEIFVPKVEMNENFFESLAMIVKDSLQKGEDLSEKIYETIKVLNAPAQVRNPDLPNLNAQQCFELVMDTEISAEDIEHAA